MSFLCGDSHLAAEACIGPQCKKSWAPLLPSLSTRPLGTLFLLSLERTLLLFRFLIGQYVTIHGDVVSHVNITHVRVEDGGQYACDVTNRAGRARHAAKLNVYGKSEN